VLIGPLLTPLCLLTGVLLRRLEGLDPEMEKADEAEVDRIRLEEDEVGVQVLDGTLELPKERIEGHLPIRVQDLDLVQGRQIRDVGTVPCPKPLR
jgi:hypothetical protein